MKILKSFLFSLTLFLIIWVSLADTSCIRTWETNLCMSITQNDIYEYVVSANCAACTMSCKNLKVGNLSFWNFKCRSDFYYDGLDTVNVSMSFLISWNTYNFNQNFDFNQIKFVWEPIIRDNNWWNGWNSWSNLDWWNDWQQWDWWNIWDEWNWTNSWNDWNNWGGGWDNSNWDDELHTEWLDTSNWKNCIWKNIWNNSVCVSINKGFDNWNNTRYTPTVKDIICRDNNCTTKCNILYNNILFEGWVSVEFLPSNSVEIATVKVTINGISSIIEWWYDFRYWVWCEDSRWANEEIINNYLELVALNISTLNTSPYVWEVVGIKIKTDKNYVWEINFEAYKLNNYNSRSHIPDYNNHFDSNILWHWNFYSMKSSDNWEKNLPNFVKFRKTGEYKIIATNDHWTTSSIIFNVSNPSWQSTTTGSVTQESTWVSNDSTHSWTTVNWTIINQTNNQQNDNQDPKEILSNWYTRELNNAYNFAFKNGITTMKTIEQANMNWGLNRIAMAKMLSQYAINVLKKAPDTSKQCSFSDVTMQMDSNYGNWVTSACQLWIMWVWITKFRPNDDVTREEFWTALSRMLFWIADWKDVYYSTHLAKLKK